MTDFNRVSYLANLVGEYTFPISLTHEYVLYAVRYFLPIVRK